MKADLRKRAFGSHQWRLTVSHQAVKILAATAGERHGDMDPNEALHGLGESFSDDGLSQQMVKEHSVAAIVGAPT